MLLFSISTIFWNVKHNTILKLSEHVPQLCFTYSTDPICYPKIFTQYSIYLFILNKFPLCGALCIVYILYRSEVIKIRLHKINFMVMYTLYVTIFKT